MAAETRVLIAADTNGHSPRWHSATRNRRGRLFEQFVDKYDLTTHNTAGQISTFCRQDSRSSNIDVTVSTRNIDHTIGDWSVSDITDSDHRVIPFIMTVNKTVKPASTDKRYDLRSADWDLFNTTLLGEIGGITDSSIESTAIGISRVLAVAADRSIQLKKLGGTSGRSIWWSPILYTLRQNLVRKRREGLRDSNRQEYNRLRNGFLTEIRNHKLAAWKCFAGELNANPWCKAFRWAKGSYSMQKLPSSMSKPDGSLTSDCRETAELLLDTFVPADPAQQDLDFHGPLPIRDPPSPDEIKAALWRMRTTGAPGADGTTAGILRKAWPALQDTITHLFSRCLQDGSFPDCWKIAKLVLLFRTARFHCWQIDRKCHHERT